MFLRAVFSQVKGVKWIEECKKREGRGIARADGEEGTRDFTRGIAVPASPQVILPLKGIIEFSCFSSLCQGREE